MLGLLGRGHGCGRLALGIVSRRFGGLGAGCAMLLQGGQMVLEQRLPVETAVGLARGEGFQALAV
ncbi:hypothetical protein D3C78_887480 [compost metagenome]